MAGGQERILRRRIRSVQSTKKITRAMELIAASRIVRAQARVEAAVPYSDQITEVVHDLADAGGAVQSPLLVPRPEIRRVGHIVLTADRGLCGAYNSSVLRAAEGEIEEHREVGRESSVYVVGRKGESYFRYRGLPVEASFTGFSDQPSYEDARQVADAVMDRYIEGELEQVELAYTRFLSVGSQRVTVGDARAEELRVELQGEVRRECVGRAHDPAQRAGRLRREEIEAGALRGAPAVQLGHRRILAH